jgi:dolichyl-phosphate-mannose--protein O-mannosyl transferase
MLVARRNAQMPIDGTLTSFPARSLLIARKHPDPWFQDPRSVQVLRAPELGISRSVRLIGLFLIAVAAGFTADVFLQNAHDVDVDVLGHTFAVSPGWVVVAGILALATFIIGARLLALGVRRTRRRKSVLRQLAAEREHKDETAQPVEHDQHPVDGVPSSIE